MVRLTPVVFCLVFHFSTDGSALSFVNFEKYNSNDWLVWKWEKSSNELLATWISAQLLWFYFAGRLELLGHNTFLEVWLSGILFFLTNIFILTMVVTHVPYWHA